MPAATNANFPPFQLSLSGVGRIQVPNTKSSAVMSTSITSTTAIDLGWKAEKLHRRVTRSERKIKGSVKLKTLNETTSEKEKKGQQSLWVITRTLRISGSSPAVAQAIARLQNEKWVLRNWNQTISRKQRREATKKATDLACHRITRRADRIMKVMHCPAWHWKTLNWIPSDNRIGPRPLVFAAEMHRSNSMPVQSGQSYVSVRMDGVAECR